MSKRQPGWYETPMIFTAPELKAFLRWLNAGDDLDDYDNLVPLYGRWLGERDDPQGPEMEIYTNAAGDRVQRIKR